jgi:hypothetical protein
VLFVCGVVVSVFAQFSVNLLDNLFFLINRLGQGFCPHFKKYFVVTQRQRTLVQFFCAKLLTAPARDNPTTTNASAKAASLLAMLLDL